MSEEWAALNYEPTLDEIKDTFALLLDDEEPGHGRLTLIPTMERYIWNQEGVFWGNRQVRDDGLIEFSWWRP